MGKNIINKSNSKSFFVRRKRMFLLTGATIVSLVPVTSSVAISTNTTLNSISSGAYGLGNMNFGSYNELMNYVNNNSKTVSVEGNNSKWTVTLNGITKSYSDPNTLRQSLYNDYIKSKQVKTDVDLATYASSNGVLGLTSQKVWKHVSYDVNISNIVYQGANDQIFANQEDAYVSYFQTKQGYTFNGVNFNDKTSLRTYLEREYFPNKANLQNTVVITSPTGNSLPINLTRTDAYETLTNFINENAEIRLNYTNKSDESVSIEINNISDTMNAVELKDLNYQHVQSNEGESRYIIDNNDSADLIGPYFYKGVLDVTSFKNKKMWKKVNGVAKSVYVESQLDSTIGSFFTSIINDDNNLNKIQAEDGSTSTLLFRTLLSTPDNKSYDKWFIEELGKLSPDLANAVIKANNSMMTGKKYNSFYKIPVLYSFLMQRAISWGVGQNVINLIVDYFTNVCNFIQDVLEFVSLYSRNLLLSKDEKESFNMVDFFQIGNPEYDINTSTAYFLNEIKTKYPNLAAMALTYTQAESNISLVGGMIPFESINYDFLWETGTMTAEELYTIKPELKKIYDTFSQLNINDMVKIYVENNNRQDIIDVANEPDTTKWEEKLKLIKTSTNQNIWDLLTSIGAKNNQYYALAESILNTEIKMFLESGAIVNGGYLDKLIILSKTNNTLSTYVNFVKKYEGQVSPYRVYLAFMLDLKNNLNIFNKESTANTDIFARRLSYLIEIVFGSSALVGNSFAKLYTSKNSVPSPVNNATLDLVDGNSDYIYEIIDLSGDKWDKSLNLGRANKDGKLFFNTEILKIDRDFINPIITSSGGLASSDQVIILSDLAEGIRNSSTDWDDNLLQLVKESNELKPMSRRGSASVIMDPFDSASLSISDSFSFEDDTVSMARNSIISGDWGDSIDGVDGAEIGSRPNTPGTYDNVDWSQKKSWWSGQTSKFNKFKEAVMTGLNYALEIFSTALAITEIVFFIFDLLKETHTQNFYQYTTSDGTSFYWNGGLTVSKYFGFETKELSNIDDMELIDPVQITLPQVEEYYYYAGLKYYNPDELKRRILLNYLNGVDTPTNPKFKRYYALIGNEDSSANTLEAMVEKVIKSLNITKKDDGSFDLTNLNKQSPYIQTLSASYDYGYIVSSNDNNVTLINNIVDNIRPAYFVALPNLGANNVATGVAGTVNKLPGKYWDGNKVIDNGTMDNVLVDNSANDLKENLNDQMIWKQENFKITNVQEANTKSLANLYTLFKSKFSVASKEVLDIGFVNNKYSQLPSNVTLQNVYEVKDAETGRIYTFLDLNAASKYLMDSVKFSKQTDYTSSRIYFEGKYFDNRDQLLKWVHENMFSIK